MNKLLIASMLSISFIAVSCDDDDDSVTECAQITADFTSATLEFNDYIENKTGDGESICNNYASSLEELVEEGCMTLAELELDQEEYDMVKNGTFCSLLSLMD